MYYGEVKFKEMIERLKDLIEKNTKNPCEETELEIKNTELKLTELFMSRYNK